MKENRILSGDYEIQNLGYSVENKCLQLNKENLELRKENISNMTVIRHETITNYSHAIIACIAGFALALAIILKNMNYFFSFGNEVGFSLLSLSFMGLLILLIPCCFVIGIKLNKPVEEYTVDIVLADEKNIKVSITKKMMRFLCDEMEITIHDNLHLMQ